MLSGLHSAHNVLLFRVRLFLGFLIINVDDADLEKVLNYLQEKKLFWEVLNDE